MTTDILIPFWYPAVALTHQADVIPLTLRAVLVILITGLGLADVA